MASILTKLFSKITEDTSSQSVDSVDIILNEAKFFSSEGKKHNVIPTLFEGESDFSGKIIKINGASKIDLTRLDYLALGSDPEIKNIIINSINKYDLSCPASQMVMKSHPTLNLEKKLAEFHSMQDSILFTSGYSVNDNLMQALGLRFNTHYIKGYLQRILSTNGIKQKDFFSSSKTLFFMDSESHYSLHHGARIAKYFSKGDCLVQKFPCMDYDALERMLVHANKKYPKALKVIVSDALSSISGKIFDIDLLNDISKRHGCLLYLDEAHSTGVLGPQGRGVAYSAKNYHECKDRLIIMGTLTKAFCQIGGYATFNDKDFSLFMEACSPQYIFSAPINPWAADSICNIIDLITGELGDKKRKQLHEISAYTRNSLKQNGFDIMESDSQIIPVVIGDDIVAEKIKSYLEDGGFMVSLFKYPAVPENHALIRFSLCADIEKNEIDSAIDLLVKARGKFKS
jgi:7-keto-8-aminopelargonate synthetase-like enzyme